MHRYADPAASRWFSYCPACVVGEHWPDPTTGLGGCAATRPDGDWCSCPVELTHDDEEPLPWQQPPPPAAPR